MLIPFGARRPSVCQPHRSDTPLIAREEPDVTLGILLIAFCENSSRYASGKNFLDALEAALQYDLISAR